MKLFELFGEIDIKDGNASSKISKMDKQAEGLGSKFGKTAKKVEKAGLVIGAAVGAMGAAMFGVAKKAAQATDRIDKMSQQMGLSREGFQELDFVLSQTGASMDSMRMGMKTLTNSIDDMKKGTGAGAEAFERLGISQEQVAKLNQEEAFKLTISQLQEVENETERAALANDLFGRSGQELMPLLNAGAGSMEEMTQKARDLGLVMGDEAIDAGVKFTDTLDQAKRSLAIVGTQIGTALMPIIQNMLEWVISNMPTIRKVFGTVFNVISTVVTTAVDIFNTYLLPVFKTVFNFIQENFPVMRETANNVFSKITEVVEYLWKWFKINLLPIFKDLFNWFINNMPMFKQVGETVFNAVIEIVKTLWGWFNQYLLPIIKNLHEWFKENGPAIQKLFENVFGSISEVIEAVWNVIKEYVLPILGDLFTWASENLSPFADFFINAFGFISDAIEDTISWFKDAIEWAEKAIEKIKEFLGVEKETQQREKNTGYTNASSAGAYSANVGNFSQDEINQVSREQGVDVGVASAMLNSGKITINNNIDMKTTLDEEEVNRVISTNNDKMSYLLGTT